MKVVGEPQVGRRFRVGLVVLVALFATMIGIFMIGQRANLFRKKFPYETRFESAAGLIGGNVVSLNGVVVGNVLEVNLSGDPADRTVRVVYDVVRRWAPMLRKGTRASIKTRGLLGDKYIELEGGKADEPEVPIGGEIPAAPGAGLEKFLAGSGDLLTDLSAIAKSLKGILGRTERGEGFLGSITSNSEESERLGNSFNATLRSLTAILAKIESGHGLLGKLLIDERYGRETSESLAGAIRSLHSLLGRIDEGVRTGNGAVGALLSDPEGKKKVYALIDELAGAAASLARVTENLEKGTGALPILLHDERFGKEFTGNLRSFSQRLDSIGRKLDEGQGTAGKLINDPAIFDAANRLVVGVDESVILRWLIKNRQRAGIRKEYNNIIRQQKANSPPAAVTPSPGDHP
ncbi:MAG TPA: MlaD family protein [Thermoanaerobaculia bacterium]|jgi:phospholipid/cholesterol/gamma-HCH transport system substrate-binding protein